MRCAMCLCKPMVIALLLLQWMYSKLVMPVLFCSFGMGIVHAILSSLMCLIRLGNLGFMK
jgi:hypothetical protein